MTRIFKLLALALAALLPPGHKTAAASSPNFYFEHYNIKNGLSQNTVQTMIQDSKGFLWFGTKDGLNRFDGINFRKIQADGDKRCSLVTCLYEDAEGLIWVGTHQGVCIYNPEYETLRWLEESVAGIPAPNGQVRAITGDASGNVLINFDEDGVFSYDKEKNLFTNLIDLKNRHRQLGKITPVERQANGRIWLGTQGHGLFYTDSRGSRVERFPVVSDPAADSTLIVTTLKLHGDKLYVGSDQTGLYAVDIHTGASSQVLPATGETPVHYVQTVMARSNSELWIGTDDGIFIYNLQKGKVVKHLVHDYFDSYTLSDNSIHSLLTDREGNIWVGSYFGGIDYLNLSRMQFDKYSRGLTSHSMPGERIRRITGDGEGHLYIGSEDNGLVMFDRRNHTFTPIETGMSNIHGLCLDGRTLWIGSFAQGLKVKKLDTGRLRSYSKGDRSGLASDYIYSICRTAHGDIYIGTMRGLQLYDRKTDTFRTVPELGNELIFDILEDSHGNLWFATNYGGVYVHNAADGRWIHLTNTPGKDDTLPSNKTFAVYEDSHRKIWVMTQNGIGVTDGPEGKFSRTYKGVDRLESNAYQVVEDDNERYWITSNRGLYCIDGKSGAMRRFTTADGLTTNQFGFNSSYKTTDGYLLFGTIEGLVEFDPLRFTPDQPANRPFASELYLHGQLVRPGDKDSPLEKSISMSDRLELGCDQNSFSLRIVTLTFRSPGSQRIRYRLKGFDKEWNYTTLYDALITYSNLDPGEYTLCVEVCGDGDRVTGKSMEMKVNVASPFYASGWAFAIYLILIGSLSYYLVNHYRQMARQRNERCQMNGGTPEMSPSLTENSVVLPHPAAESMPAAEVQAEGNEAAGNHLSKVEEDFLRRINELIQANFSNPDYSMEDVFAALGMSRTTFYRKIKGLLDLSPSDYIKMERLKHAARMFREGHTNVSEVCYKTGFSSPGYFSKCFQKQFGMVPKEFIASLGGKNREPEQSRDNT